MVSMSTTWIRRNPDNAWRRTQQCQTTSKASLYLLSLNFCTFINTIILKSWSYQVFEEIASKSSSTNHQNLACLQQELERLRKKHHTTVIYGQCKAIADHSHDSTALSKKVNNKQWRCLYFTSVLGSKSGCVNGPGLSRNFFTWFHRPSQSQPMSLCPPSAAMLDTKSTKKTLNLYN